MLRLHAFSVSGYRAFAQPARVELRSLTLLYGRNNAGKSALLRLLRLLSDSVADSADSPLTLSGPAGMGSSYLELPWQGQSGKRIKVVLEWKDDGAVTTDTIEFDYQDDPGVYVRSIQVAGLANLSFKAESIAHGGAEGRYEFEVGEERFEDRLEFSGLLPTHLPRLPALAALRERLLSFRQTVTWLMATRTRPGKTVERTGARPRLEADGANADAVLLAHPEVLEEVARWYGRPEIGRELSIKEVNHPLNRILLNPRQGPCHDVLLKDTGEGMTQILPVLVAAAQARLAKGTRFLCIEEPESHLHADAQRALATYLAELAMAEDPPIILLETHSRVLLLGIQLAIARGLSPERAIAYWVDQADDGSASVARITFSEKGHLRGWPAAALTEDRALARELVDLQIE